MKTRKNVLKLHLFEGYGIELEYIIVHRKSLNILPVSDELIRSVTGKYSNEALFDNIGWSNEFVRHVIELRNNNPVTDLSDLASRFQDEITTINDLLTPMDGMLMPTSMHPWMNPGDETKLWHRQNRKVYEAYHRIFNCNSHGWANIQSMQLNLPFYGNQQFGNLHAAVRLVLPIIPALSASSPIVEGKTNGCLDNRLNFYSINQLKVPSIMGSIIPEAVYTQNEYKEIILKRMYNDVAIYDPEGTLQYEWLNSRGAIPRFDRNAIEIRLADIQECPVADIAVASAIIAVTKALVEGKWQSYAEQSAWDSGQLLTILRSTIRSGEKTLITNNAYLEVFGYPCKKATAGDVWRHIIEKTSPDHLTQDKIIRHILNILILKGTLARRILNASGNAPTRSRLQEIYKNLCQNLREGTLFEG